jgi:hypothetical protein
VHGLRELGFERINPVHPMGEILDDGFELYSTRSEIRSIPEFGMVFRDRSGIFWNQVDSCLSPQTIDAVLDRFGHVDVLFAMSRRRARAPHRGAGRRAAPVHRPAGRDRPGRLGVCRPRRPLRIDVVLPDGDARSYQWEFGSPTAQVSHRIAATALLEWATHTKDFFSVRCWSRRSQLAYRVRRDSEQTLLDGVTVPDLVMHYLINVAPGSELAAKHHIDAQLRQLAGAHARR